MSRSLLAQCTCFSRTSSTARISCSSSASSFSSSSSSSANSYSGYSESSSGSRNATQTSNDPTSSSKPVRQVYTRQSLSNNRPSVSNGGSLAANNEKMRPRTGESLRLYLKLSPEEKIRDDLARQRRLQSNSPEKLYALERERQRVYDSRLENKPEMERDRLARSARAIIRPLSNSTPVDPRKVIGSRLDRNKPNSNGGRDEPWKGVNKYGLNNSDRYMTPGKVNRNTVPTPMERKGVQPVIRGGIMKSSNRKVRPKILKKVVLPSTIRLENLTNLLGVKLRFLQRAMDRIGLDNSRPERLLTAEDASLVALELNFDPIVDDEAAFDVYPSPASLTPELLPLRPPVTGIFGHVDHGKTSLLDRLRSTTVAAGEAGGITQHIGAFEVSVSTITANLRAGLKGAEASVSSALGEEGGTITFLDTPGHAAFTAMRERGAGVTDVVVLVVAADDGVKPQTEEVIGLIKSSDVGVVVAITKIDKPGVDITKVKQSLMAAGVEIEAFGGDIPCVEVSSVTGQGLPELLETIAAIAEVRELKAEREGRVEGRVLESRVEKGRGNVATVLVTRGCLRPASSLIAGTTWCRVRSLVPPSGATIKAAYPGQPVEVTGWKDLPSAGDQVLEANTEDEAKKAVANRLSKIEREKMWEDVEIINEKRRSEAEVDSVRKEEERKAKANGLKGNAITQAGNLAVETMAGGVGKRNAEGIKELVMIIKADVSGTVEAVVGALQGIGNSEAKVKIIFTGVGDVQESDVDMAKAVEGCIVGFNVKAPNSVLKSAATPPYAVPIYTSPIIYRLVETVKGAVADLLPKTIETRVHGEALVQQLFEISIKGRKDNMKVAGCKVGNGVFQKGRKARVMRNGTILHTGTVSTLKQVKKDVTEVTKGVECGIALEDFDEFEADDIIQSIEEVEVARAL